MLLPLDSFLNLKQEIMIVFSIELSMIILSTICSQMKTVILQIMCMVV